MLNIETTRTDKYTRQEPGEGAGLTDKSGKSCIPTGELSIDPKVGTVENKKGYVKGGYLVGNSNTGKLHSPGCRAIGMIKSTHKVPTDGAHFVPCKWCYAMGESKRLTLDDFRTARDEPDDIELCIDRKIESLFKDVECNCGSKDGILKMYPHEAGVRLLNRDGKWWIYRECYSCGYQLSLVKAQAKRKKWIW